MTDADVLHRRAHELAQPLPEEDDASTRRTLLRFRRADGHYAVDLRAVHQVARLDGGARLPRDAWPLLAIAPLDGRIVAVTDPFTAAATRPTSEPLAWGVAIEARGHVLFLLADEVLGVVEIDPDDVTATPSDESGWSTVGVSPDGDAIVDLDDLITKLERLRADRTHQAGSQSAPAPRDLP